MTQPYEVDDLARLRSEFVQRRRLVAKLLSGCALLVLAALAIYLLTGRLIMADPRIELLILGIVLGMQGVYISTIWRCPRCKGFLGFTFNPSQCPRCSVPLQ